MFQYFRTCLHYAYGMESGKEIINILEDHGASEFSMDKVFLTLCLPMDFPIQINTIRMGLFSIYFKGSQIIIKFSPGKLLIS